MASVSWRPPGPNTVAANGVHTHNHVKRQAVAPLLHTTSPTCMGKENVEITKHYKTEIPKHQNSETPKYTGPSRPSKFGNTVPKHRTLNHPLDHPLLVISETLLPETPPTEPSISRLTHPFRNTVWKHQNTSIHLETLFRNTSRNTETHTSIPKHSYIHSETLFSKHRNTVSKHQNTVST